MAYQASSGECRRLERYGYLEWSFVHAAENNDTDDKCMMDPATDDFSFLFTEPDPERFEEEDLGHHDMEDPYYSEPDSEEAESEPESDEEHEDFIIPIWNSTSDGATRGIALDSSGRRRRITPVLKFHIDLDKVETFPSVEELSSDIEHFVRYGLHRCLYALRSTILLPV